MEMGSTGLTRTNRLTFLVVYVRVRRPPVRGLGGPSSPQWSVLFLRMRTRRTDTRTRRESTAGTITSDGNGHPVSRYAAIAAGERWRYSASCRKGFHRKQHGSLPPRSYGSRARTTNAFSRCCARTIFNIRPAMRRRLFVLLFAPSSDIRSPAPPHTRVRCQRCTVRASAG